MTKKTELAQEKPKHDPERLRKEFEEFVDEFKNESDRAAVILGASKLDQLLGMLLERHLLPCPSSNDQLFTNNGPLGTFSSKIDLSFRLGIIDAEMCSCIHMIRRIRNSFAHEVYGASLDSGSHKDRVRSLVTPFLGEAFFEFIRENFFDNKSDSRSEFSAILGLIIVRLETFITRVTTAKNDEARTILPKEHNNQNQADA